VGSTLSSISIFSQMAQQQSKEVIPMLETIEESSRKMLDAMADIVWTINPENDQFEKIILRMRSFAYELLGVSKIDFEFIADEDVAKIKLPMNVRKNLYLIFKEATNNMVKYSGADKAVFMITEEKNKLTMLIHDNGKGFDSGQSKEGNGLKNMKRRADEIRAQFKIDSYPGKGTSVQLSIAV
jgi:signal transduction histidine kinase